MYKSIEPELTELRERLGPSAIAGAFKGIHHILYQVNRGDGDALVKDFTVKTNYKLVGMYLHKKSNSCYSLMKLKNNPIGIVIVEKDDATLKFPRLTGIAFKVADLDLTKNMLRKYKIFFSETEMGLVTPEITGFGDTFAYVENDEFDWFQSSNFSEKKIDYKKFQDDSASQKFMSKIGEIDHIAYRIRLDGVKTAAKNLMQLTDYQFSDCYTIGTENAETMVFRWKDTKPAIVASYGWESSSVVWQYVEKYGPRVHHVAYYTQDVLKTVDFQMKRNIEFTTEKMIGSADRGILQIFTKPSPYSHEITEYIERFHGFAGFFDKGNVGNLMRSTKSFN